MKKQSDYDRFQNVEAVNHNIQDCALRVPEGDIHEGRSNPCFTWFFLPPHRLRVLECRVEFPLLDRVGFCNLLPNATNLQKKEAVSY